MQRTLRGTQEKQHGSFKRSVRLLLISSKIASPVSNYGLTGDSDVGQCPVPPRLGRGHHELPTANVAGVGLRGELPHPCRDHLGGHLDELCGPKHRPHAV